MEESPVKAPFAALALFAALAVPAAAQENPPTLSANGEGIENAAPDIAIVTLGVLTQADTARAALDGNNAEMEKVIQSVRGESIADKDISTNGFSIGPVYAQDPSPRPDGTMQPPKIVGYQVSNQVRVVIRDLDKAGVVLDKAVTAGANQAASINFDIDDRKALADKAITAAIADATRKAELMAEAAGVRLVRILHVSVGEGGGMPRFDRVAMSAKAVPIMGGEMSVSANASISWEIAPK
jgi:uncharacterized protein YggE